MRGDPHGRWLGNAVIGVAAIVLAVLTFEGATHPSHIGEIPPLDEYVRILIVYGVYSLVGGLLLRHSVHNPIGALVALMGLVPLLGNLAEVVVARGFGSGIIADVAEWVIGWYFYAFFGAFVVMFHVFPTGRAMAGAWRWWARIAVAGYVLFVFVFMFGPPEECLTCSGVNPFEIPLVSLVAPILMAIIEVALLLGLGTGLVALGVRFARAHERERAQLKWFFLSVVIGVGLFFGMVTLTEELAWLPEAIGETVAGAAFILPAIGVLVAVTRHGLFDIDRIVSRTVSYTAVALVIAVVYVVPVVVLPEALGLSSDLTVALATLAAAAAFTPVRRRVQTSVVRRFDRERYDAELVVASFSGRLQNAVDLGRVTEELNRAVGAALHPATVSVWFGGGRR